MPGLASLVFDYACRPTLSDKLKKNASYKNKTDSVQPLGSINLIDEETENLEPIGGKFCRCC